MQTIKPVFYTVAFLLEIGMLFAFFAWGFRQGSSHLAKYAIGIGVAVLVMVFWGVFMSPKASYKIGFLLKMAIEVTLFAAATLMLYKIGYKTAAVIFAAGVLFKEVLSLVYRE